MAVLINFKICDNVPECPCIEICPNKAIYYDKEKKTLVVDNSKCTSCGSCENECPVGAMRVAQTDEEYERIKKEIDEDPRKISDLFIDKYGAQPLDPDMLISEKDLPPLIESEKLTVVELFKEDLLECLLRSIPIKKLFPRMDMQYKKLEIKDDSLLKKYNIKELPTLLFFKAGKLLGKIEGYYNTDQFNEINKKIKEIIP
jgi:NAD-dependent dihydropyrimidine dehydrogenase PreA subunit